jgi:hypothetical protein
MRCLATAEQAGRLDQEHEHERGVEDGDGPVRLPDVHDGLECQHEHRRHQGTADAAEPGQDDQRE